MTELLFLFKRAADVITAKRALLGSGLEAQVMAVPQALQTQGGYSDQGILIPPPQRAQALRAMAGRRVFPADVYAAQGEVIFPMDGSGPATFTEAFGLHPGAVVSVIGCGGKSALIQRIALENRTSKRVLLSTTTRMRPPADLLIDHVLEDDVGLGQGVNLLAGEPANDTLSGASVESLRVRIPDADLTLLKCDDAGGLPLKGWTTGEPAVMEQTTLTIGVCVLWPVDIPLTEAIVYQPEQFFALTGARPGDPCTLSHISAMISRSQGMFANAVGEQVLFINHLDETDATSVVRSLASMLPADLHARLSAIYYGSLRDGTCSRLES